MLDSPKMVGSGPVQPVLWLALCMGLGFACGQNKTSSDANVAQVDRLRSRLACRISGLIHGVWGQLFWF